MTINTKFSFRGLMSLIQIVVLQSCHSCVSRGTIIPVPGKEPLLPSSAMRDCFPLVVKSLQFVLVVSGKY